MTEFRAPEVNHFNGKVKAAPRKIPVVVLDPVK
jgi:hypothetical protein